MSKLEPREGYWQKLAMAVLRVECSSAAKYLALILGELALDVSPTVAHHLFSLSVTGSVFGETRFCTVLRH